MRYCLLVISIIGVLLGHGWSAVFASALCPHAENIFAGGAGTSAVILASQDQDRPACCRQEKANEGAHCSMPQRPAPAAMRPTSGTVSDSLKAKDNHGGIRQTAATEVKTTSIGQISCAHCVSRPGPRPAPGVARELRPAPHNRSEHTAPGQIKPVIPSAVLRVCAIVPSPGAPPGSQNSTRRHLLHRLFLI